MFLSSWWWLLLVFSFCKAGILYSYSFKTLVYNSALELSHWFQFLDLWDRRLSLLYSLYLTSSVQQADYHPDLRRCNKNPRLNEKSHYMESFLLGSHWFLWVFWCLKVEISWKKLIIFLTPNLFLFLGLYSSHSTSNEKDIKYVHKYTHTHTHLYTFIHT